MTEYTLPEPALRMNPAPHAAATPYPVQMVTAYSAAQMQAAYDAGLAQSEPQTAFCPACFVKVALHECDAVTRDAKLWREHAAGLTASSEMVPLLDGEWLARRTDEAYQQGLRAAPEGDSKYKALYEDLIFQVSHKFKDETRHQTAKRYIASWEGRSLQPESAKQSEYLKCSL